MRGSRELALALALGLLSRTGCIRLDTSGEEKEPPLVKKVFGPEHRACKDLANATAKEGVIGGEVVKDPGEFPFIAWLGDNDGTMTHQFCGGSLISDRVVLTAGHCIYGMDSMDANLLVRLGVTDYSRTGDGIARRVINWRRHPDYTRVTVRNDVTLLLLNESVPASLVRPLRLSDGSKSFEHSGGKMVVGWGSLDESCSAYSPLLRKTEVPFGSDGPECSSEGSKTLTPERDFDWKSQCCAGDYAGAMHYPGCGDSGGPLLARDDDWWSVVGMVSWSYGVPWPDVFTRVSYFRDWIEDTMAALLASGVHPAVARSGQR